MDDSTAEMEELERSATEVAPILRALGNERRLMIVCKLVEWGEANVSSLAEAIGISQSALSQHLTKLRNQKIITFRRESQTLWYRIADPRIEELFAMLHGLFCHQPNGGGRAPRRKKDS